MSGRKGGTVQAQCGSRPKCQGHSNCSVVVVAGRKWEEVVCGARWEVEKRKSKRKKRERGRKKEKNSTGQSELAHGVREDSGSGRKKGEVVYRTMWEGERKEKRKKKMVACGGSRADLGLWPVCQWHSNCCAAAGASEKRGVAYGARLEGKRKVRKKKRGKKWWCSGGQQVESGQMWGPLGRRGGIWA